MAQTEVKGGPKSGSHRPKKLWFSTRQAQDAKTTAASNGRAAASLTFNPTRGLLDQKFLKNHHREDMVLFSMTPSIVAAVKIYNDDGHTSNPDEALLEDPAVGKPISHSQIIDIAACLKRNQDAVRQKSQDGEAIPFHLADLLRGSSVYVPPPKPKPAPSSEYEELMARLRREEEARLYERMLNPRTPSEKFSQRFPNAPFVHLFDERTTSADDDEMTYQDVDRQLTLIINILVTVVACSIAVWIAARRWDTPQRLALSMLSSIVLAVAEVVIYWGYINRLKDAKITEKKKTERKEVIETWVIEPRKDKKLPVKLVSPDSDDSASQKLRLRKSKVG